MKNLQRLLFALSMLFAASASAQGLPEGGYDKYKPSIGQEGKDVIWQDSDCGSKAIWRDSSRY